MSGETWEAVVTDVEQKLSDVVADLTSHRPATMVTAARVERALALLRTLLTLHGIDPGEIYGGGPGKPESMPPGDDPRAGHKIPPLLGKRGRKW